MSATASARCTSAPQASSPTRRCATRKPRTVDAAAAAALEDKLLDHKGWSALGAFDPVERTRALDLLGFECQLVFSTFAPTQFLGDDPDLVYGGTRAHNRAMVDFCADDPRLVPVGFVPWGTPEHNAATVQEAIDLGCGAVLASLGAGAACRRPPTLTTTACGARSRTTTSRSCSTSAGEAG